MNVLFILASFSAATVAVLGGAIVSEDYTIRILQGADQTCSILQNTTIPSCGDCIYSDFRGDVGDPGPQVCCKKAIVALFYFLIARS